MKTLTISACILLSALALPVSAGAVTYRLRGTTDDGGKFDGTFSYITGPDNTAMRCYAVPRLCKFPLESWDISVTGGFYDGLLFQGAGWDPTNIYMQYAGVGGVRGQSIWFSDFLENYLTVSFAGTWDSITVPGPFPDASLFAEGEIFGPGLSPVVAFAARASIGIAADAPTDPIPVTGAQILPVPEPGTALTGLVGLSALAWTLRRQRR